ncbi:MAG: methyltransferase domain-containing protein [Chloroflexi bacterium]|nr:methyltransferase domain-containing protein [Chloroflexota bacterium]
MSLAASTLSRTQWAELEAMLRNESDVAYRRRVRTIFSYLELAPGQTVLDCGTGMGFYVRAIAELYPSCRVYGLDYEERVLRYGQQHLRGRQVLLVRGDVHHLALAGESVDRVVMSEVLEHLADDRAALAEVWRVLKPGGILALTVPYKHYPYWYDPINRLAEDLFQRPIRRGPFAGIWANHERLYDQEGLLEVVRGAGFAVERCDLLTHYCFPGTQTIVYTLGKTLVERNLLPEFVSRSADRFRGRENRGSRLNPVNWMLALFHWIDRFNEDPKPFADNVGQDGRDEAVGKPSTKRTFVNLAVKARKV